MADAEVLADGIIGHVALNFALARDLVLWLGGEEPVAGETRPEKGMPTENGRERR